MAGKFGTCQACGKVHIYPARCTCGYQPKLQDEDIYSREEQG